MDQRVDQRVGSLKYQLVDLKVGLEEMVVTSVLDLREDQVDLMVDLKVGLAMNQEEAEVDSLVTLVDQEANSVARVSLSMALVD